MGTPPGSIVGISLWSGLVFASELYLVGFSAYAQAVIAETGLTLPGLTTPIAPSAASGRGPRRDHLDRPAQVRRRGPRPRRP